MVKGQANDTQNQHVHEEQERCQSGTELGTFVNKTVSRYFTDKIENGQERWISKEVG